MILYKKIVKNKYISVVLQFHDFLELILKICKLGHEDVISKLSNIGFWIWHTKLPP